MSYVVSLLPSLSNRIEVRAPQWQPENSLTRPLETSVSAVSSVVNPPSRAEHATALDGGAGHRSGTKDVGEGGSARTYPLLEKLDVMGADNFQATT